MKRPKESLPTRLTQPTFRPRRDKPIATLVSAPARRRVYFSTSAKSPTSSATNNANASPYVTTSSCACVIYFLSDGVVQKISIGKKLCRSQHRHIVAGHCFQILADNGKLDRALHAAWKMREQAPPDGIILIQWNCLEFALVIPHPLAVHVLHVSCQRARGNFRIDSTPAPVAHIEGHADRHTRTGADRQKIGDRLQLAAMFGLVVLQQQRHRSLRHKARPVQHVAGR